MNNSDDNKQEDGFNIVRRILAITGISLIAIGEYLIAIPYVAGDSPFPPRFWLSIFGIVLLLISLFLKVKPAFTTKWSRLNISDTTTKVLMAVFLSALTIFSLLIFEQNARTNYIPVILTWLASGALYIVALHEDKASEFTFSAWIKKHKTEILLVGLAILVGGFLRFYQLGAVPRVLDGDEGRIGLVAKSTETTSLADPFALWENIGSLYLQVLNWGFYLFGTSAFSLRLLAAISGTLAIPMTYLLARQIAGPRIAVITTFLLATSHAHIHFSRISSVFYIHDTWLVPLELYLLLSAIEKRSSWRAAAAGIILGIHFRVYLTSQVIVALVLIFMLISFLFLGTWLKSAFRQCAVFWGGFSLMMAPQLKYIFQQPEEFMNRLGQDGTFQTGWLQLEMENTGHSALVIFFDRIVHAFMSLVYYPAVDFYGSSSSLLSIFSAILFLVGIGLVLVRVKIPGYLLLNGYFWGVTAAIAIFSLPPSADSYRMLAVLPAAFMIAAIGLDYFLEIAGVLWATTRRSYLILTVGAVIGISLLNIWLYYFDFAGKCRYGGGVESRFASYLGSYAKTVDVNSPIYLLSNDVFFYGSHASADFLSDHRAIINYNEPMDDYQVQYGETIVASPARIDELITWSDSHPGGAMIEIYDCKRVILVSYTIPIKPFEP